MWFLVILAPFGVWYGRAFWRALPSNRYFVP